MSIVDIHEHMNRHGRPNSDLSEDITPEWRAWLRGVIDDESNGWTKSALARAAGCSPATIGRILYTRQRTSKDKPRIDAALAADGILPPEEQRVARLERLLDELHPDHQDVLLDIVEALNEAPRDCDRDIFSVLRGTLATLNVLKKR